MSRNNNPKDGKHSRKEMQQRERWQENASANESKFVLEGIGLVATYNQLSEDILAGRIKIDWDNMTYRFVNPRTRVITS